MKFYLKKYESYEGNYPLTDAIARLSSKVKGDNWRSWLQGGIFGSVKSDRVILRYHRPLNFLSVGIRFKGSFTEKHGVTTLTGTFSLSTITQVFMPSWFILTISLFFYSLNNIELLPIPVFMVAFWFVNLALIIRLGKSDIERISQMLRDTL